MKVRFGAAALLAFVTLTACSSSTNGKGLPGDGGNSTPPSDSGAGTTSQQTGTGSANPPGTTSTGSGATSSEFCTKLEQAQTKLGDIGSSMSDPSKAKDVLKEEAAVFSDLEKSAPSDIKPAIHDLATVMAAAAKYFENPGSGSTGALQDLTTKLPEDIQMFTTYVAANCR
jgi:hypothetical protein